MAIGSIVGTATARTTTRQRRNLSPRGNKTVRLRVTDSSGATHSTVGPCGWPDSRSPDSADSTPSRSRGRAQGAQVSQPINLEDRSVLGPPSTNFEGAISSGEGHLNNGTQFDAELSPNTNGRARRAGFPRTRAKTAVFALAGACAVVFGASFAAAALTGDDEPERAGPALSADTPSGRSLDLGAVARLPDLREQPSPEPAAPRPLAASAHLPEPASSSEPEPAAPPPEPVAPPPEPAAPAPVPVAQAPAPEPAPSPEPQPVTQPSQPAPQPYQPAPQPHQPAPQPAQPAPIEVYDSGG
jgi:hypothetical protein